MSEKKLSSNTEHEFENLSTQMSFLKNILLYQSNVLDFTFFSFFTEKFNGLFNADYTYVAKLSDVTNLETLSIYSSNGFLKNLNYNIAGTPCEKAISQKKYLLLENNLENFKLEFPFEKELLTGYLGIPIFNSNNETQGIVVCLFKNPINKTTLLLEFIDIFANKVSQELEKIKPKKEQFSVFKEPDVNFEVLYKKLKAQNDYLLQTEEKLIRKNNELKESDKKLNEAQKLANIGHYNFDLINNKWESSKELKNIFGIDETYKSNFEGWVNIIHPSFKNEMIDYLQTEVIKKRTNFNKTYKIINQKTNEEKWVRGLGSLTVDENGILTNMLGTIQDISLTKQTETSLIQSEKQLQLLLDNSPSVMMLLNSKTEILRMNRTGLFMSGSSHELGKYSQLGKVFNCIYASGNEKKCGNNSNCSNCMIYNSLQKTIETSEPQQKIEAQLITNTNNKQEKLTVLVSTLQVSKKPEPIFLVTLEDITTQKKADFALEESYIKYKILADYTFGWEYWLGPDGSFKYVSPSCKKISEYSDREFYEYPKLLNARIIEKDHPIWNLHDTVSENNHDKSPIEVRFKTKSGKIIWIEHICKPVFSDNGVFLGRRGSNRDISKQKQNELEVIETKNRFKQLADTTKEGIVILKNSSILDSNKALESITGYSENELIGRDFLDLVIPSEYKSAFFNEISNEIGSLIEIKIMNKNGQQIPVEISSSSISKTTRSIKVLSVRDITEQKQMQQNILNAIITAEENERKRISQDLHDGLGPLLSATKLYIETYFKSDNEAFKEKAKGHLLEGIEEALQQVSTISNNLSPHVLNDFGLEAAIKKFIEKISYFNSIKFSLNYKFSKAIKKDAEITIYRVATELINNTLKHAKATSIDIFVGEFEDTIQMIFKNDGIAFNFDETKKQQGGMGLFNIINRVKSLNGTVEFKNQNKIGISYEIKIPLR